MAELAALDISVAEETPLTNGSSPFLDELFEDESPRPVIAAKNRKVNNLRKEGRLNESPLLGYVKSSPKLKDGRRVLENKPPLTRNMSAGYVDTDAADLGAVPMRGEHRDDWLKIQVTTFTNWTNDRLSGSKANYGGTLVHDLKTDFEDGLLLIRLLENLTGKKIPGIVRNPIFTAQKIANLDLSFEFMRSEGVRLTAIGESTIAIISVVYSVPQRSLLMFC